MPQRESPDRPQASRTAPADCPKCQGDLAVMRVVDGPEQDYWTMRCIRCGGIHLYIVQPAPRTVD